MTVEIVRCLLERRETFLSRPEWVQRPWKLIPKTALDELNDAMLDMPAIFRQFDEVSGKKNQNALQNGLRDIAAKLWKTKSTVQAIYDNFEKSVSGPLYWPELSTLESPLDDTKLGKVFPVQFHFSAFFVATVVTTYWSTMMAAQLQLMYTLGKLAAIESPTSVTDSPLRPTAADNGPKAVLFDQRSREHGDKWIAMARNCCQSAEYFLQDRMGELGSLSALTILAGCLSCFAIEPERWSREIGWITDLIGRIKKKCNIPVGYPMMELRGESLSLIRERLGIND